MKKVFYISLVGLLCLAKPVNLYAYSVDPYFPDVPHTHWAFEYVQRLYEAGISEGYPDGTYKPANMVSRAELAAYVIRTVDHIDAEYITAWHQTLPAAERFELVMGGEAVLDKETRVVWEQSPSSISRDWYDADEHCIRLELGGRKGWHLPTIQQLQSLVDNSVSTVIKLPDGHPFSLFVSEFDVNFYWSATTANGQPDTAWGVAFGNGDEFNGPKIAGLPGFVPRVWCVRGGQIHDAY